MNLIYTKCLCTVIKSASYKKLENACKIFINKMKTFAKRT